MTNLEWLLANNKSDFIRAISVAYCWGVKNDGTFQFSCDGLHCADCQFGDPNAPCSIQKADWLEAEHEEPLLFPIGTIVEVTLPSNERDLQYYNGVHDNRHFCTHFHSYIGKTDSSGKPNGLIYNIDNIRKVGD